jgi:uncharacterized membrane protein YphA (DoxX/SURF4 family)
MRIVVGFLFFTHGGQKLFGWFGADGTVELLSRMGVAGILEFVGGLMIMLGLFTRPVAFIPNLHHRKLLAATLAFATVAAGPALSQERAFVLFTQAGYQIPFSNLSQDGDELQSGWTFGGGLGLQLGAHYALRGVGLFGHSDYRGPALTLDEPGFRRMFVSLEVQTGLPTSGGWAPYAFAGAGLARMDPKDLSLESFSSFMARFGAGTNYVLENSFLTFFLESGGVVYDFGAYGFSGYQFDLQVLLGLAYAIPY